MYCYCFCNKNMVVTHKYRLLRKHLHKSAGYWYAKNDLFVHLILRQSCWQYRLLLGESVAGARRRVQRWNLGRSRRSQYIFKPI